MNILKYRVLLGLSVTFMSLMGCDNSTSNTSAEATPASIEEPVSFEKVNTEQGPVQGIVEEDLIVFKGIPYAAAPVGNLRWRAPQAALPRPELLVADAFGNRCFQRPVNPQFQRKAEDYIQPESEDCLYLNIYRPADVQGELPVLVWIPGGGLVSGSGSRPVNHGGNLAREDVLVVSINYRLGSFGFFAHPELSQQNPDDGVLFNYGLMDQVAALRWVQKNIAAFGGNPEKVTIAGESAGGYSVNTLMSSPLADGLFSAAISQSGYGRDRQPRVASLANETDVPVETVGTKIAEALGMPEASLAELKSVPAEKIVEATDFSGFISFAVDGVSVTDDLHAVFSRGEQTAVPLMIGSTDFEFGMVPPTMQRDIMKPLLPESALDELEPLYFGEENRDTLLYSEYVFTAQARALAQLQNRLKQTSYFYRFSVPSPGMKSMVVGDSKVYGAAHAADLPYMFGNFTGDHGDPTEPSAQQKTVSEQMVKYWANFAKTTNPNGTDLPEWKAFDGNHIMQFTLEGSATIDDSWQARLDKVNELKDDFKI